MSRAHAGLVAGVLLGLGVLSLLVLSGPDSRTEVPRVRARSPASPPPTASVGRVDGGTAEPAHRTEAQPDEAAVVTVVVVDDAQQPVAGSFIECVPPGRTVRAAEVAEVMGPTTSTPCSIPRERLVERNSVWPGSLLRARNGLRRSAAVPIATAAAWSSRAPLTFMLLPTTSHRVVVLRSDTAEPVPEVAVVMSAAGAKGCEPDLAEGILPGAACSAIHGGRTGADGACSISGLTAGEYMIAVHPRWPYAVAQGPQEGLALVPGRETVFAVRPMVAAVLAVVGPRIVTWNAQPKDMGLRNPGHGQLVTEVKRLQRQWDNCVAFVGFPVDEYVRPTTKKRGAPRVHFRVLLAGVGWIEQVVEAQLLSNSFTPAQYVVREAPGSTAFGVVTVVPADGAGRFPEEWLPPVVLQQGGRIPDLEVAVSWNKPLTVPAGDYRIECVDRGLRLLVPRQSVRVEAGPAATRVEMTLPGDLLPVRILPRDLDGSILGDASLFATSGDRRIETRLAAPDSSWCWLPAGLVAITVKARGFQKFVGEVALAEPGQVVDVRMTPGR